MSLLAGIFCGIGEREVFVWNALQKQFTFFISNIWLNDLLIDSLLQFLYISL